MLYVHNFFLILTFVSYKHRTVTVGKEYTSEIGFEVMKVIYSHCLSTEYISVSSEGNVLLRFIVRVLTTQKA